MVNDDVAKALNVPPRNGSVTLPQLCGELSDSLADDRQLVDHGTAVQGAGLECTAVMAVDKLRDGVGGRQNVFEIEPLTPHR